jgi:hypothetical protein
MSLTSLVLFIGYVGEVIEGMELVRTIEALGSDSGAPKQKIVIAKSGTL